MSVIDILILSVAVFIMLYMAVYMIIHMAYKHKEKITMIETYYRYLKMQDELKNEQGNEQNDNKQ